MSVPLLDKDFAAEKLKSTTHVVEQLLGGKFPYSASPDALEIALQHFNDLLEKINSLPDDPDLVLRHCSQINYELDFYKRFLGLILRSSNVRNALEVYMPLRALAEQLLGPDIKIIISSEWDFIPFIYPKLTPELRDFIFIGLPASESQNGLLIPIAGHELGHAVWRRKSIDGKFRTEVTNRLLNKFGRDSDLISKYFPEGTTSDNIHKHKSVPIWTYCWDFTLRQIEEIFCDFLGLWLFGSGYLYAFQYLVAPGGGDKSGYYPSPHTRAKYLLSLATRLGDPVPANFLASFPHGERIQVAILIADEIVDSLRSDIEAAALYYCSASAISESENERPKLHRPTTTGMDSALQCFRRLCPVSTCDTIADIINAGWALRVSLPRWRVPGVSPDHKILILRDLIFKSLEVREWSVGGQISGSQQQGSAGSFVSSKK